MILRLLQSPELVALVAAAIGWGVVRIAQKLGKLPLTETEKLRTWVVAAATSALAYTAAMVAAAVQTGAPVDWVAVIVGAVLAGVVPSGLQEADKARARMAALRAGMNQ